MRLSTFWALCEALGLRGQGDRRCNVMNGFRAYCFQDLGSRVLRFRVLGFGVLGYRSVGLGLRVSGGPQELPIL